MTNLDRTMNHRRHFRAIADANKLTVVSAEAARRVAERHRNEEEVPASTLIAEWKTESTQLLVEKLGGLVLR